MAVRKKKQASITDQTTQTEGFTKAQLLSSNQYKGRYDLLSALLEDGKQYSLELVNKKIDGFMKGQAK